MVLLGGGASSLDLLRQLGEHRLKIRVVRVERRNPAQAPRNDQQAELGKQIGAPALPGLLGAQTVHLASNPMLRLLDVS